MSTNNLKQRRSTHPDPVVNALGSAVERKILFVDDEPLILRAFQQVFRDSGIEVETSTSASDALERLSRSRFSVVLSDYQMPEMNGLTLLEASNRAAPDVPRILISGANDLKIDAHTAGRVGLFAFVDKPWDNFRLRQVVERAMEHHSLTAENRGLSEALLARCTELGGTTQLLEQEVQNRTTSLLLGLVNALDLRDTETQSHSRRVALYARRLAMQIGLDGDDLLTIERGALLHDVGKIGVSDTILLKPGSLSDEEWEEMRRHSEYGYRILEGIEFLGDARLIVRQHHERWDGTGYPLGLAGEDIYLGARIFAVIDAYDAMTSNRYYRKALDHDVACAEIRQGCGSQFDPDIVGSWDEIPREEIFALRDCVSDPVAGLD